MKYERLFWFSYITLTIYTIIDRFTFNLWPLGIDNDYFDGHWTIKIFDYCARITGRLTITSTNVLFMTQCHICANWLIDHKPTWLEIDDIREIHKSIHIKIGKYGIGIPILIHVWSILLPAVFGINLKIMSTRPIMSNGNQLPFSHNGVVNLTYNDVYRLVLMSVLFLIIFPYSLSKFARKYSYSMATWIHLLAAFMYTIDLLRMPSHPHAHIFNTPVVFLWIVDRLVGIYFYRAGTGKIINKIKIDDDYYILLVELPQNYIRKIGDCYWFKTINNIELGHPFTSFFDYDKKGYKHYTKDKNESFLGHKFYVKRNENTRDEFVRHDTEQSISINVEKNNNYIIGIIMQVHDIKRVFTKRVGWTKQMSENNKILLKYYGPYRTDYRDLMKHNLQPLILIGSGSGAGYIIDYYNYIKHSGIELKYKVIIYYTSRSIALMQLVSDIICHKKIENLEINIHLTSNNIIYDNQNLEGEQNDVDLYINRVEFENVLSNVIPETEVYFCGAPSLYRYIKKICNKNKLKMHNGHVFQTT